MKDAVLSIICPNMIKTKLLRNYTEVLFFMLVYLIAFKNTINKCFLLHPPLQVIPELLLKQLEKWITPYLASSVAVHQCIRLIKDLNVCHIDSQSSVLVPKKALNFEAVFMHCKFLSPLPHLRSRILFYFIPSLVLLPSCYFPFDVNKEKCAGQHLKSPPYLIVFLIISVFASFEFKL